MIAIQLQLLFSPFLVSRPLLPHSFPAPLTPEVDDFLLLVGGEGGALAHCQHLEAEDVHGGIFLSLISRCTWGHIYVVANIFLHLTPFSLLCSSTLHLNLRYMVHSTCCLRSTHSLFSLLPLKPGLAGSLCTCLLCAGWRGQAHLGQALPPRLKELSSKLVAS